MGLVARQLATLGQLHSLVGSEWAQLHSNFQRDTQPTHVECPLREKLSGLVVVAAVNGRGEVMAARDTQRNYGHDVGSMAQSDHLTPSPWITPQLKYSRLKLTPPSVHLHLQHPQLKYVSSAPETINQLSTTVVSTCSQESPHIMLTQKHRDILQEPGKSSTGKGSTRKPAQPSGVEKPRISHHQIWTPNEVG